MNKYSIPTFIIGIIALIPLVTYVFGPIAIVLGLISFYQISKRQEKGLILSIMGIVLAIIGISFSTYMYSWLANMPEELDKTPAGRESLDNADRALIRRIQGQIELFKAENSFYPFSLKQLKESNGYNPQDVRGNEFEYKLTDSSYVIIGRGADGELNTKDDVKID